MEGRKVPAFRNMNVLRLHLELITSGLKEEDKEVIKKHGFMKEGMTRDVLVPDDITFHALSYAIMRCFGWQNSHLHFFRLPDEVYEQLTEGKYMTWAKMAGIYFRFPSEDFEDLYWDDDYQYGQNYKTWMRKKYTGPYKYKGFREEYLDNQLEIQDMFARHDEVEVGEFDFKQMKTVNKHMKKLKDAGISEIQTAFADVLSTELIERVPIVQIMSLPGKERQSFTEIRNYINEKTADFYVNDSINKFKTKYLRSEKKRREFMEQFNIPPLPVTDYLIYEYDTGDGWEVSVSIENEYHLDEHKQWKDSDGLDATDLFDDLMTVVMKYRPVCIAKDGIEVLDDVGGIGGFCEMLETIYECDMEDQDAVDQRYEMIEWAHYMGWSGKMIPPENTL